MDQGQQLAAVREVRRRLAEIGPDHTRAEGDFERVALPPQDCDVLRDLLVEEGPGLIIEVGLAYGSSALAIGEALVSSGPPDGAQLIIDAYQHHFWDAAGMRSRRLVSSIVARCCASGRRWRYHAW